MRPVLKRRPVQKIVSPHDWELLAQLAEEHWRLAELSMTRGNWHGATLAAAHAASTWAEAVIVNRTGSRTATENPGELAHLLLRHVVHEEAAARLNDFLEIVERQKILRYEQQSFGPVEAEKFLKMTQDFTRWTKNLLPI